MTDRADGFVLSVNTAATKGAAKSPRTFANLLADHGMEGDAHAGPWHRQISLLAQESIAAMQARGAKVGAGSFGENVTTEHIPVQRLPVGARLRLGEALVEVTQIGKVCHDRCAIFAQVGDCVMPRDGVFARVVQGGEVRPGDPIFVDHVSLIRAAVLTVSDRGSRGERADESGAVLEAGLRELGAAGVERRLVADEQEEIAVCLRHWADETDVNLVLTTGGTGMTSRDVTPEATLAVLERFAPGFAEAMRASSLVLTPHAMLSRAMSGIRGRTLIINMPGSPKACREQLDVIAPALPHAIEKLLDLGGECGRSADCRSEPD